MEDEGGGESLRAGAPVCTQSRRESVYHDPPNGNAVDITSASPVAGCGVASSPDAKEDLTRIFRALGHPARLAIIEALAQRPNACCGDIVNTLPLAQSTVSQHLQVLKETGLLTCSTRGRCCHYDLNRTMLQQAGIASGAFFERIEDQCAKAGAGYGGGDVAAAQEAPANIQIKIQKNGAHHANEGEKPHGDTV